MDKPELLVVPRLPDWDLEALAGRFTLRRPPPALSGRSS